MKLYTQEHLWLRMDSSEEAYLGLSQEGLQSLGSISSWDLPSEGTELKAGSPLGTVESLKTLCDLIAPCSGGVLLVNPHINPQKIQEDPENTWLLKLKPRHPLPSSLMDERTYRNWLLGLNE